MRESVERKKQAAETKKQMSRRRIILYGTLFGLLGGMGGFLLTAHMVTQRQIDTINAEMAQADKDFAALIQKLRAERLERERRENEVVRSLTLERTLAGYMEPPALSDAKCNYLREHYDPTRIDVMVNKQHCVDPLDFEPEVVYVEGVAVATSVAADYRKLLEDIRAAGYNITATSGFRSYADQAATYNYWFNTEGQVEADLHSALPGYSEHQTGLAIDFQIDGCALECFGRTDAYKWLKKNSHKYGYIERYTENDTDITGYGYEPWHWRYVGIETATELMNSDATTLEQLWKIP